MSSVAMRTTALPKIESKDAELCRNVERALAASGYMPLRAVEVRVREGLVQLRGHVPTYYLKQMAQTAVMQRLGVEMLQNDIEVISTDLLPRQFRRT